MGKCLTLLAAPCFSSRPHGLTLFKSHRDGTDIVIVDWEDAVAPNLKTEARNAVGTFFGDPRTALYSNTCA